jgi:antibiotic biosynthesis monooxygenase (ABM) superfamily enzyme
MTDTARSDDAGTAQAVITLKVAPGSEAEFRALEGRLGAACQSFPGFLTSEIVQPVAGVQEHWALRVRFASPERLQAWLDSDTRRQLLEEMAPLLLDQQEEKTVVEARAAPGGVTVLLHTRPRAGKEAEYSRWQAEINAAAAALPGFQEARVFPAQPPYQPEWAVAYSFDTQRHLQDWLDSSARRDWLQRGEPLFEQTGERRLAGGFGSWFAPKGGDGPIALPPGWKQVMVVLLALYPTAMLLSMFLGPQIKSLPMPAAMFISNLASCVLLQYFVTNMVSRPLHFWLMPDPAARPRTDLLGTGIVLVCYAVLVAVFLAVAG